MGKVSESMMESRACFIFNSPPIGPNNYNALIMQRTLEETF